MAERFAAVLLGVLLVVQVARRDGSHLVADAEVRIQRHRLQRIVPRLLELALRRRFLRRRVETHDVERGRRQVRHREHLIRLRRLVTERLAHRGHQLRRRRPGSVPCSRPSPSRSVDHVAGHRLRRLDRHAVAAALAVERAGQDHAQPLLDRDLARRHLVQLLGRPHAERAADCAPVERADEARAFQRALEHRLQRAIERRIVGAILEVRDHHRDRIVLFRRLHGPPRHDERAARARPTTSTAVAAIIRGVRRRTSGIGMPSSSRSSSTATSSAVVSKRFSGSGCRQRTHDLVDRRRQARVRRAQRGR